MKFAIVLAVVAAFFLGAGLVFYGSCARNPAAEVLNAAQEG